MDGQTQSEEATPGEVEMGHQSWDEVEEEEQGEEEAVGEARSGVDETINTSTDHDAQRFSVVNARRADDQPFNVVLSVNSAAGLRRTSGSIGKYCRIVVETDEGERELVNQTSVRKRSLDPVWDEEFFIKDLFPGAAVRVEVWDKDTTGSDEFLGQVTVKREMLWNYFDESGGNVHELKLLSSNASENRTPATGAIKLAWHLGEVGGKGRWKKPLLEKALAHRRKSRPWDKSRELPHPLSSSFIADGDLGDGLALWMQFLKSTSLLFFILFLINLPAFIFYLHGTGLSDEHGRPASGNAILALPSLGNLFGKADLERNLDPSNESKTFTLYMFGKQVTLSRNLISILLPALDLLGILILLIFVVRLRYVQHAKKTAMDKKTKTAADYTVMVTGIYGTGVNPELLQKYFERYGKVEVVSVARHTEDFLTFKRTAAEISEKIAIIEAKVDKAQQLAREAKKKPPLFWVRDAEQGGCSEGGPILASRSGAHMQTVFEFERSIKALEKHKLREKLGSAESKDVYAAFITFALPDGKTNCLESVSFLDTIPFIGNRSRGPQMKHAVIEAAPEVSNVSWEHLAYSAGNRRCRSCVIVFCAAVLLAASFFIILVAQVHQRRNALPSCPPAALESKLDWETQEYFENTAGSAWGPGTRFQGLRNILSEGFFFDKVGVCEGPYRNGFACASDAECVGVEGAGVCRVYDLRCSYKDALERANNKSNIREMSQADRALLLSASFVHAPSAQATHAAAVAEGSLDSSGDASSSSDAPPDTQDWELQWGALGEPPMCNQQLRVLKEEQTSSISRVVVLQEGYSFDEANYTLEHTASGALTREACLRRMPDVGQLSIEYERCRQPPVSCMRWPGCNVSSWPGCTVVDVSDARAPRCVEQLTVTVGTKLVNATDFKWASEVIETPQRSDAEKCSSSMLASGNVTCVFQVVVEYETNRREFTALPVYSKWVCARYKTQCASCFCVDTIADFWLVWLFSLSPGYSALCSSRFSEIVKTYSIFVGSAVSVTGMNQLLRILLRAFAGFEKKLTKSDTEKSIAVKILVAQFFNTALVPLIVYAQIKALSETVCRGGKDAYDANDRATFGFNGMPCRPSEEARGQPVCAFGGGECRALVPDYFPVFNGDFSDFSNLWYSSVSTSILITVTVNMVLTLLPVFVEWPMQIVAEKMAARSSVTQSQLNRSFEGPEFQLAPRYGVILNNIFSCMLYSAGTPVFYLIAAATCLFTYIGDKVSLHYLYKTPPCFDDKLAVFTTGILPAAAGMHLLFGVWKYSSVMPLVPVSQSITSSIAEAMARGCEEQSVGDPWSCVWACEYGRHVKCAEVANGTLFKNDTLCLVQGAGRCLGRDPSMLDFNFSARLFTWSSFPMLMVVCFLLALLLLWLTTKMPCVRPFVKLFWSCCCCSEKLKRRLELVHTHETHAISYTQALCLTEQQPQATSAAADGSHESQPSHVQWLYRDAFSDRPVSDQGEVTSDSLWLSPEAHGALARVRSGRGPALRAEERERGSSGTFSNAAIC